MELRFAPLGLGLDHGFERGLGGLDVGASSSSTDSGSGSQ